jgi:hypothetical protein
MSGWMTNDEDGESENKEQNEKIFEVEEIALCSCSNGRHTILPMQLWNSRTTQNVPN